VRVRPPNPPPPVPLRVISYQLMGKSSPSSRPIIWYRSPGNDALRLGIGNRRTVHASHTSVVYLPTSSILRHFVLRYTIRNVLLSQTQAQGQLHGSALLFWY